jgi:signal peptidase I
VAAIVATGAEARLRVHGGSMLPTVRPGDALFVRRGDASSISRGSVILAKKSGRLIAHRVRRVDWRDGVMWITTRGDARNNDDLALTAEHVVGNVIAIERDGRRLRVRQRSPFLSLFIRVRGSAAYQGKRFVRLLRTIPSQRGA